MLLFSKKKPLLSLISSSVFKRCKMVCTCHLIFYAYVCANWIFVQIEAISGELESANDRLSEISDEKCALVSCHL